MWQHFAPASDFAGAALVAFYAGGCMRSGGGSGFMCGGWWLFCGAFLVVLADWALGYRSVGFGHFPNVS